MATAWWTSYAAQTATAWQEARGGAATPILYFIQDFEPGFYPWSSQSAVASSTYRPETDLGVSTPACCATTSLRKAAYARQVVNEPTLNASLRPVELEDAPRERTILVYARPSVPRKRTAADLRRTACLGLDRCALQALADTRHRRARSRSGPRTVRAARPRQAEPRRLSRSPAPVGDRRFADAVTASELSAARNGGLRHVDDHQHVREQEPVAPRSRASRHWIARRRRRLPQR